MKKKVTFLNLLITAAMVSISYLIMKYHDTMGFQAAMKFLFNPDTDMALPSFWQDNRMMIIGCLMVALFLYYSSIWISYKNFIQIQRDSHEQSGKPSLSALQASYHYQQDQTRCVVTWLIDLCSRGALSLHYRNGSRPWSVSRGTNQKMSGSDQELVEILFQEKPNVSLRASFSDTSQTSHRRGVF